jgi:hypothetical protein
MNVIILRKYAISNRKYNSCFRCCVEDVFALLDCYALAQPVHPIFRNQRIASPLKMAPVGRPEMSKYN